MSDYIKREDVKHAINSSKYYGKKVWRDILDAVYNIPSADVAPVRHGRWKKNDDYTCSICGYQMVIGDGAYNYCSNCGAKMDEEDEQ